MAQSYKKTWLMASRTWTTGSNTRFKSKMVGLADSRFWRVTEDGTPLTYSTQWEFNLTPGGKIGRVSDLTDGIRVISPTNGKTYKVYYDEYYMPFQPIIGLYRTDGYKPNRNIPQNTIGGDGGSGRLVSLNDISDDDQLSYEATYDVDPDPKTIIVRYATHAFCINYPKGEALGGNLRIEIYKQGRHWSGNRESGAGEDLTTMDNIMCPQETYTTNAVPMKDFWKKKRHGKFFMRIRNTETNEVSLFSFQTIKIRGNCMMQSNNTTPIARYRRVCLD